MILKLKMKDQSRKNIEIIKSHFFDASDKITAGYIIGIAVERTKDISDSEWKNAMNRVLYENESSGNSTSVSLRQEIFEEITQIKEKLKKLCGKSLYMSQVIDIILFIIANKLGSDALSSNSLKVMEWNIHAGTGFANYVIPVNLIVNQVFDAEPHIFVFTEFVQSAGWIDLKTILEKKYHIFDSAYLPKQNGICIGIRKECGIEFLSTKSKNSVFGNDLVLPDFYEVKVRVNSKEISVIGTRIRIDYYKARSKDDNERIDEQKQRFEQYSNLIIEHIAKLKNDVIMLGDFNNSRILGDEIKINIKDIDKIYSGLDSIEYNFQKIRAFAINETHNKLSLYTPKGDKSSIGAFWDFKNKKAKSPVSNSEQKHKYDHLITNFVPEKLEYNWDFLKLYDDIKYFNANGTIKRGYPDHAILLAVIKI
ncbi:MAG: endonuclease/exonuclease/phosphatase family protein [Candidatus Fimenecus sp.]